MSEIVFPRSSKRRGEKPITRILEPTGYIRCLETKLDEEVSEYHESHDLEELADILVVVFALAQAEGHTKEELFAAYDKKNAARGGFDSRIFLIAKE